MIPPLSISGSAASNPLAQLGDVKSGGPVVVFGGGKGGNMFLIVGLIAGAVVLWLIFRPRMK